MNDDEDILVRLADLHKQATVERSHFYSGRCIRDAMAEITRLRQENSELKRPKRKTTASIRTGNER